MLVLNKYPVIAQHFILATAAFARQGDLLGEGDLAATFACLRAWGEGAGDGDDDDDDDDGTGAGVRATKRLFAFFNSGPHSGASQPHRHVQFLPVERMREDRADANADADAPGSGSGSGWSLLADRMAAGVPVAEGESLPPSPFAHWSGVSGPPAFAGMRDPPYERELTQQTGARQKTPPSAISPDSHSRTSPCRSHPMRRRRTSTLDTGGCTTLRWRAVGFTRGGTRMRRLSSGKKGKERIERVRRLSAIIWR